MRYVINMYERPWTPPGWRIKDHCAGEREMEWDPQKILFHLSNSRQKAILGGIKDLQKKLGKDFDYVDVSRYFCYHANPMSNACLMDYLLAYPEAVPSTMPEWTFFWGTVYESLERQGDRYIRCLHCDDKLRDYYCTASSALLPGLLFDTFDVQLTPGAENLQTMPFLIF